MKVAYVLASLSRANGGVSESVRRLAQTVRNEGRTDVAVLGLRDANTDEDLPAWTPLRPQALAVQGPRAWGYAPRFREELARTAPDVSHVAGLWMYPSAAHHAWARAGGHPYVIAPHGMLDAWALRNSAWKKRLAALCFERAHLAGAACLQALCAAEARAMRAFGLRNPICVVPNGIDLPALHPPARPSVWAGRIPEGRSVMLFLGRLHPKKGLRPLLQAWARVRSPDWHLVVAGWDQGGHQRELQALASELRIQETVCFCGPLHGPEKAAAYATAHAFVLPSFSEGLPMTVLEAWSFGLPVLMTAACNLPEGFRTGSALEISTEPAILGEQLGRFMAWSVEERASMGARGRDLAAGQFCWERVAGELGSVYRWVTGQGPRPACMVP